MKIQYKDSDLWAIPFEAVVIPVNCIGVWGAGLAKQARDRYPDVYHAHRQACQEGAVKPGTAWSMKGARSLPVEPPWLVCVPTKRDWRDPSRLEDVEAGATAMAEELARLAPATVAIPALGCGLGGLAPDTVRPLVESALRTLDRSTPKGADITATLFGLGPRKNLPGQTPSQEPTQ